MTDREIVEVLETMTLAAGLNRYCDALEIEPDAWLEDGPVAGGQEEQS